MDMIAMLNGLGRGGGAGPVVPPTASFQELQTSANAQQAAAQTATMIADKVKKLSDADLFGLAQAAMQGAAFGDSRPEQVRAAAGQIYAEVVARYGPGKLAELAGYQSAAASAAMVQAATAKQAAEYAKQVSPMMAGAAGLAVGELLGWFIARR